MLLSANAFSLGQFKILSFGKENNGIEGLDMKLNMKKCGSSYICKTMKKNKPYEKQV